MLNDYRKKIDEIDATLIALLSLRFDLVEQIGLAKKQSQIQVEDKDREAKLTALHKEIAEQEGIDPAIVERVFQVVLEESRKHQEF